MAIPIPFPGRDRTTGCAALILVAAIAAARPVAAEPQPGSTCNPRCPAGTLCDGGRRCATTSPAIYAAWNRIAAERAGRCCDLSARRHDGFYARSGLVMGYALDRVDRDGVTTEAKDFAFFQEEAVGGTLDGGWVLGGGLVALLAASPPTRVDGVPTRGDHASFFVFGPFVDWFPEEHGGWHVTALLGIGVATLDVNDDEDSDVDAGLGVGLGGGYDLWIANQAAAGVTARLLYIGATDERGTHQALIPTLSFTYLYH